MMQSDSFLPHVARFRVTSQQGIQKECKVTLLVPAEYRREANATVRLNQLFNNTILRKLTVSHPEALKNDFLPAIKIIFDGESGEYIPDLKNYAVAEDPSQLNKIELISLTQFGIGDTPELDSSAAKLLPLLSTLWPLYKKESEGGKKLDEIDFEKSKKFPEAFNNLIAFFGNALESYQAKLDDPIEKNKLKNLSDQLLKAAELGRETNLDKIHSIVMRQIEKGPVTIPMGYYRGGNYIPMLLIFKRELNGTLTLSTTVLDPALGAKTRPYHRYMFSQAKKQSSQVKIILELLLRYKEHPAKFLRKDAKKGMDVLARKQVLNAMQSGGEARLVEAEAKLETISRFLDVINDKDPEKMGKIHGDPTMDDIFIETQNIFKEHSLDAQPMLMLSSSLNPSAEDEKTLEIAEGIKKNIENEVASIKRQMGEPEILVEADNRDVLTIIHSLITKQPGVVPTALPAELSRSFKTHKDKLSGLFSWLYQQDSQLSTEHQLRIETLILLEFGKMSLRDLEKRELPIDSKKDLLNFLNNSFKDLEKKYQKEFGSSTALQRIWDSDGVLNGLLAKIRDKIAQSEFGNEPNPLQKLGLYVVSTWGISQVNEELNSTLFGSGKIIPFGIANLETLRNLRSDISNNFPRAKDSVNQLYEACKSLYAAREFHELEIAATTVLTGMPEPLSPFWQGLSETQLSDWSQSLSDFTAYLWEASIKQGNTYVWPETVFALMKTRANLHELLQLHILKVHQKMFSAYEALDADGKEVCRSLVRDSKIPQQDLFLEFLGQKRLPEALVKSYLTMHASVVGRQLGLSQEDVTLLLAGEYKIETQQAIYLLTQHPYFRYSRDRLLNDEVIRLANYFHNRRSRRADEPALSLDSMRNFLQNSGAEFNPMITMHGDRNFFWRLQNLLVDHPTKKIRGATPTDLWAASWERSNGILPPQLVDWRRHLLYSQVILHPRSTMFKGFPLETGLTQYQRIQYIFEELNKVQGEDAKDYNSVLKMMTDSQARELLTKLQYMGPLELVIGKDPEKNLPSINITDASRAYEIFYQPTGIDVYDYRHPHSNQAIVGDPSVIPQTMLISRVGTIDQVRGSNEKKIKEREQLRETILPTTEVTIVNEEQSNFASTLLTPEINARLRSLNVQSKEFLPSPNAFYNVIDFILDYPYLLESETVQKIVEQTLYQTGVIQKGIEDNPHFFIGSQVSKKFNKLIQDFLNHDNFNSAVFLLQVGATVNKYTLKNDLPDFSFLFSRGLTKVKASELLLKAARDSRTDARAKKIIYTALLHELFLESKLRNLSLEENLIVFKGHAVIKNAGAISGDLMVQTKLLNWVEQSILRVMKRPLTPENQNLLTALATDSEIKQTGSSTLWGEKQNEPFVYESTTGVVIDLRRGIIQSTNLEERGFATQLPIQIKEHPDFVSLFGKQDDVLATTPPPGKLDYLCFTFSRNEIKFKLLYHSTKKELQVYQVINNETYRYSKIKVKEGVSERSSERLLERYGFWKNQSNPDQGYLICTPAGEWKESDLIAIAFHKGTSIINTIHTRDEQVIVNDPKQRILVIFPFIDPSDVIISHPKTDPKAIKVRIISKGIELQQDFVKATWNAQNELKGYTLIYNKERLYELSKTFGTYYSEYLMPFEKRNDVSGITTTLCQIFPVRFKKPMKDEDYAEFTRPKEIDTRVAASGDVAALSVISEMGRVDGEDGRIKSSSTGFFYLAYVSFFHGDYDNAIRYLEKSLENPFVYKEKKAHELIEKFIREHKDSSIRGLAFRLKAELAIRSIRRDKIDIKEFRPHSWKAYLDKIREDIQLFRDYKNALDKQKGHRKTDLLGPLLILSEADELAYNKLIKESFDFLVQKQPPGSPELTPAREFIVKTIDEKSLEKLAGQLARYMRPSITERIENIPPQMSKQEFLSQFWGIAHAIVQCSQRVTVKSLQENVERYSTMLIEQQNEVPPDEKKIRVTEGFLSDYQHKLKAEQRKLEEKISSLNSSSLIAMLEGLNVSILSDEDALIVDSGRQLLVSLAKLLQYRDQHNFTLERLNERATSMTGEELAQLTEANIQLRNLLLKLNPPFVSDRLWHEVATVVQSSDPKSTQLSKVAIGLNFLYKLVNEKVWGIYYNNETQTIYEVQKSLEFLKEVNDQFAIFQKILGVPKKPEEPNEFSTTIEAIEREADIRNPNSVFTNEEKVYWGSYAKEVRKQSKITGKELQPINEILQRFVQQKTATPAIRHEYETIREIKNLQVRLKQSQPPSQPRPESNRISDGLIVELNLRETAYITEITNAFASNPYKPSESAIAADMISLFTSKTLENEVFSRRLVVLFSSMNSNNKQDENLLLEAAADTSFKPITMRLEKKRLFGLSDANVTLTNKTALWYLTTLAKILAHYKENKLPLPADLVKFQSIDEIQKNTVEFIRVLNDLEKQAANKQLIDKMGIEGEKIKSHYFSSQDPMEEAENKRIRKAIDDKIKAKKADLAANILHKDVIEQDSGVLRTTSLDSLQNFLNNRKESVATLANSRRIEILTDLFQQKEFLKMSGPLNKRLHNLLSKDAFNKGADWKAEILDIALDLYKNNDLVADAQLQPSRLASLNRLEQRLTEYLYLSTELQQIRKGILKLNDLRRLLVNQQLPEDKKIEWEDYSQDLLRSLQGAGRSRYIQNGYLVKPEYSRKHLVAEYRSEMIARKFQPEIVEKMVENPNKLILLRPGAGKSKWITPEVAQLLAKEKNKFPVILVTDEMLDINRADMDKTTLELFKQAGHIFDYQRNSPKDPAYFADEYKRLLQVQQEKGYVITTIGRMASVEDEIVILHKDLKELYDQFLANTRSGKFDLKNFNTKNETKEHLLNMMYIQKQLHWLKKIRELFRANSQSETKEVAFIADEVDAIFSPNNDYNFSIEEKSKDSLRPPDPVLTRVTHQIMQTIFKPTNHGLEVLGDKLRSNKQSTLNGVDAKGVPILEDYIRALALGIYDETTPFGLTRKEWQETRSLISEDEHGFIDFVTGKSSLPPRLKKYIEDGAKPLQGSANAQDPNFKPAEAFIRQNTIKYVLALKHLLKSTLRTALSLEANTDYGLDATGKIVVPKKERRDLPGVRFGNEYDNVVFQYLYQVSKSFNYDYFSEFFRKKQYEILAGTASEEWKIWYDKAMSKEVGGKRVSEMTPEKRLSELYQAFKNPGDLSSTKVRFAMLSEDTLPNHLKVFCAQAKCNSQDPLHGVNLVGASGTVNEYALPDSFDRDESVYSREVMADTLFKLAGMDPQGLDVPITEIAHPLNDILEIASNVENKFIVDQGAVLEEFSTRETVEKIRSHLANNKKPRQILFVDQVQVGDKSIRKQMMWNPGESEPQPFDRSKLDSNGLFYFAPADIRGTDWPMPTGYGVLVTGANTTDEQFIQAIWRARRLGQGQNVRIRVHKEIADKLKHILKKDGLVLADVLKDIQRRTLTQTAGQNYKSRVKKIQAVAPQEIKKSFFKTHIEDEIEYWHLGEQIPEAELRILSDIALDSHYFDAISHYFIEERMVKFAQELDQSFEIDVMSALKTQSDLQVNIHKTVNQKLNDIDVVIKKELIDISNNARPNLPRLDIHPETDKRLEALKKENGPVPVIIQNYYQSLAGKEQHHLSNLKQKVSTGMMSGDESSQEMVQQQEQEQQQQQQQVMALNPNAEKGRPERTTAHALQWVYWPQGGTLDESKFEPFPGLGSNIIATPNYLKLWNALKIHQGDLLGRLVVYQDNKGDRKFVLIDNLDLEIGFRRVIKYRQKNPDPSYASKEMTVYSLRTHPETDDPGLMFIEGLNSDFNYDGDFYLALIQIKLSAGQVLFKTSHELLAVEYWVQNHPDKVQLKSFLCKIHGVDVVTQIPGWENSILKNLL